MNDGNRLYRVLNFDDPTFIRIFVSGPMEIDGCFLSKSCFGLIQTSACVASSNRSVKVMSAS